MIYNLRDYDDSTERLRVREREGSEPIERVRRKRRKRRKRSLVTVIGDDHSCHY